jgi:hypothetical protein
MKEDVTHDNRKFSVEMYDTGDVFVVELWENNGDQLYWYGADFFDKSNALAEYNHVKANVSDFID